MGLLLSHLHLLAIEQERYPIKGDVLTLGQHEIYETLEGVKKIFISHGIKPKILKEGFDTKNKIFKYAGTPRGELFTNGYATLSMLGAERVFASDVSDYENPDYLIDLNYDVDEKYYEKFDMVLDSGTLEHIFDISTALSNIVKMVKKGGRIFLILPCSNFVDHGFYSFSPILFFDFFRINGFSNFNCYLIEESMVNCYKKSKIYKYSCSPDFLENPLSSKNPIELCFCATKNNDADSRKINKPDQGKYLNCNWGNKTPERSIINSGNVEKLSRFEKIKREIEFSTRKFRPEFVDIFWKSRKTGFRNIKIKNNLTYLGKF